MVIKLKLIIKVIINIIISKVVVIVDNILNKCEEIKEMI